MDGGGNWDDPSYWAGACEEDSVNSGFDPDTFLTRGFLPPPPRPPGFLDPPSDGLTTCDLCVWATHNSSTISDSISFVSWSFTLVIVSVISAVVGAVIMVSLRRCLKKLNENPVPRGYSGARGESADKSNTVGREAPQSAGLCCWITRRTSRRQPSSLRTDVVTASNHYTLEETYSGGAEALYAELDKPVYQNTGYVLEPDTNSPPSSAYYSDLSDRTYETVGANQGGSQQQGWEMHRYRGGHSHHHHHQPSSDYV